MKIQTRIHRQLSDTLTPVNTLLAVREQYPQVMLLESSDYQSKENSYSFLGFAPLASAWVSEGRFRSTLGHDFDLLHGDTDLVAAMDAFRESFTLLNEEQEAQRFNGLFGYTGFEAVAWFDEHSFTGQESSCMIPDLQFHFFAYLVVFDHYNSRLTILENQPEDSPSQLEEVITLINKPGRPVYPFRAGAATANMSDTDYIQLVSKAKAHCQRGDVFQLVLSRRYRQAYRGDDINVYRALRAINPSPYLFYFDYGDFKIMGSSPEAHLIIKGGQAEIHPIAGTVMRSGDNETDHAAALQLAADPKENAEHNMLVDLARNDLAHHCRNVRVSRNKVIQYFSHVIHLVSKVVADKPRQVSPFRVFADTFPAGTLTGAPKHKAIELIHAYEPQPRDFYGGAIGYMSFDGDMNMAITIRTVMAKDSNLYYQAGAGIVIDSQEENELREVQNKLAAIRAAIKMAEEL